MKKLFAILILFCLWSNTLAYAGFIDKGNSDFNKPAIMIGEVCGYVDFPVKQEFLDAFEDVIKEQLQNTEAFRLEMPSDLITVSLNGEDVRLGSALSQIHMNAIANGRYYQREQVSAALLRYTDQLFGFRYQPEKPKKKADVIEPYQLSSYLIATLNEIREKLEIEYLLFCNVKQVDARRSINGLWNKMNVNLDYYLIGTENGKVYESNSFSDKSVQKIEVTGYFKYSKTSSANQMLHDVLEQQAKRIVKDISINGINALRQTKKL